LMGFDLKCIKCGMGRILAINAKSQVSEIRVYGRREKMGKRQSGIYATISSVSGKTPEKPKNKVIRKVSQKFPKIINIIK